MTEIKYHKDITALLVVDPYNDFISEGGKIWNRIRAVAEANDCVPHMLEVLNAARKARLAVFYALHRRYRPGDYESWKYIAPIQKAAWARKSFEFGTWGGEKDATADYSDEATHAALDVNLPNYASAIMTTDEIVALISSVETSG